MKYNFKSDIIFYDVPENTNGKMLLKAYKNQSLESVVKLWLIEGHDFVLEENSNSGYGKAKTRNIIYFLKEKNKLKYFFNYVLFPDLSPIKNC